MSEFDLDHLRAAAETADLANAEVVSPVQLEVATGEMRLNVLDWGGPSDTTILLLHGGGLTAHTWDLLCLTLRPNYRCIAPDLRGHGDSAWSAERRYRLDDHRGDVQSLVEYFELDRFVLVGMS